MLPLLRRVTAPVSCCVTLSYHRSMWRGRRRRFGQHFLTDKGVANAVVAQLADEPARVVEVGPGRGALTAVLAARFPRVLALEVDQELAASLEGRWQAGVQVVHGDALVDPLEPWLAAEAPWQLASNLPYSVGTAIVRRLLPRHDLVTRMVVMLQQEVAARLVALPGQREHGLLALERAAYGEARLVRTVPPTAFRPRPKVQSAVVLLDLHPPRHPPVLLRQALALSASALTHQRKMLHNALGGRVSVAALEASGLDPDTRPGTVDLDGWVRLALRAAAPV